MKTKKPKSKARVASLAANDEAKHPFPKQDPNKPRPVAPIADPKPVIA